MTAPDPRVEAMRSALQTAWDEFGLDTGCFPECFSITRGPKIWANFALSNFAQHVAEAYIDPATAQLTRKDALLAEAAEVLFRARGRLDINIGDSDPYGDDPDVEVCQAISDFLTKLREAGHE